MPFSGIMIDLLTVLHICSLVIQKFSALIAKLIMNINDCCQQLLKSIPLNLIFLSKIFPNFASLS